MLIEKERDIAFIPISSYQHRVNDQIVYRAVKSFCENPRIENREQYIYNQVIGLEFYKWIYQ